MMRGNLATSIDHIFETILEERGTCPNCGGVLWGPKAESREHPGRKVPGTCPSCGYSELHQGVSMPDKVEHWSWQASRQKAIDYFMTYSQISQPKLAFKKFDDWSAITVAQQKVGNSAFLVAKNMQSNKELHCVIAGPTGTGKSHLASAILWRLLDTTEYQRKCLIVSVPELISNLKQGMKDNAKDIAEKAQQAVNEAKKCDLLILDDLGSDMATNYVTDVITGIVNARVDKAMVVTTNLSPKEISDSYGDRIYSRIASHSQKNNINTSGLRDYRVIA